MLRFLSIKRLAVIDAVEIEFGPGFNVLTGETGAGKSILVEAVGLLLGGRSSGDLVRTGEDAATVEAIFEFGGQEIHVRREISASGRSRAFVNDDLVTAGALKARTNGLIELHGQHEHHTLLDPSTHLGITDQVGGFDAEVATVAAAFGIWRVAIAERDRLRELAESEGARAELAAFQLAEMDQANLTPGEDASLASTRAVLANAERVERLCTEAYSALYEDDRAVVNVLAGVWKRVSELADLDPQFAPFLESRDGIRSQIEDLAFFLRRYSERIEASPARLQQVNDRLATVERLKKKYGPSLDAVIARREALRDEFETRQAGGERLAEAEARVIATREGYVRVAEQLSAHRRASSRSLSRRVETALAELSMPAARFDARLAVLPEAEWSAEGIDRAEFYISANPGEELRPLARIASGGELSRIMLALRTISILPEGSRAADGDQSGASGLGLIFDEVDSGIGGRVADVVGQRLRELGGKFQVLCITHLPQIASCADSHFEIAKTVGGGRTRTLVRRLDDCDRVEELSRMIGGASITDNVRASARDMLIRAAAHASPDRQAKAKGERRKSQSERS